MKYLKLSFVFLAALISSTLLANAQTYEVVGEESKITVEGTSTFHDWYSEFLKMKGRANINVGDNKITDISDLVLEIFVESFESGKNGMEKNAREALRESKFPMIQFALTRLEKIDSDEILGLGLLTIAGATRDVSMNVGYSTSDEDIIVFEGSLELNMTDFEIDPPTALLGTIKTGDPVSIHYKVHFKKD